MNEHTLPPARPAAGDALQATFLDILPRLMGTIRAHFRHVPCPDRRADLACEAVALCWAWHVRLARANRTPAGFAATFARLAARAAASGRRVCGSEKARDVLSPVCRWRRGFAVTPLPNPTAAGFDEVLRDDARTPVPDQVAFRLDFPRWRRSLGGCPRELLDALAAGHRATDVAIMFGLTAGRVSQVRRELHEGWRTFCGDDRG